MIQLNVINLTIWPVAIKYNFDNSSLSLGPGVPLHLRRNVAEGGDYPRPLATIPEDSKEGDRGAALEQNDAVF